MKIWKLFTLLIILAGCSSQVSSVKINNIDIPVKLAITEAQRENGLMYQTNLTGGMLFVYDSDSPHTFWMKNMLIPLDIIYIGGNGTITNIWHAPPCTSDQCYLYPGYGKYVLEVNENFTNVNNISVGDTVSLVR